MKYESPFVQHTLQFCRLSLRLLTMLQHIHVIIVSVNQITQKILIEYIFIGKLIEHLTL